METIDSTVKHCSAEVSKLRIAGLRVHRMLVAVTVYYVYLCFYN